jgi:hypothetical protein
MISTEVAREARKIPETLEIRSVPCWLPFQDRLSIAVDASNPLLGPGTAPIMCQLRHIKSRWERAPRNKREIKDEFETRLQRRLRHSGHASKINAAGTRNNALQEDRARAPGRR